MVFSQEDIGKRVCLELWLGQNIGGKQKIEGREYIFGKIRATCLTFFELETYPVIEKLGNEPWREVIDDNRIKSYEFLKEEE